MKKLEVFKEEITEEESIKQVLDKKSSRSLCLETRRKEDSLRLIIYESNNNIFLKVEIIHSIEINTKNSLEHTVYNIFSFFKFAENTRLPKNLRKEEIERKLNLSTIKTAALIQDADELLQTDFKKFIKNIEEVLGIKKTCKEKLVNISFYINHLCHLEHFFTEEELEEKLRRLMLNPRLAYQNIKDRLEQKKSLRLEDLYSSSFYENIKKRLEKVLIAKKKRRL